MELIGRQARVGAAGLLHASATWKGTKVRGLHRDHLRGLGKEGCVHPRWLCVCTGTGAQEHKILPSAVVYSLFKSPTAASLGCRCSYKRQVQGYGKLHAVDEERELVE
ncbi:hypothetical protein GOP47_0024841 [Adiantum capillus-veneris]|uniref:Uncharacterized protein n=1 Tax=Adiantum capillus-veneris TaxID=13818 RepID=A0A9D4U558_ADICA|nr:hypothetical protein GOP47_0024841 [Adiantum capillus-veneris]